MDRTALESYLTGWWAAMIDELSIDTALVLDEVEAFYTADSDLDTKWAKPLGDYFLLKFALHAFLVEFDVTLEGDSYRLGQRADRLQKLFDGAYGKVSWLIGDEYDGFGEVVKIRDTFLTGWLDEWRQNA